MVVELELGLGAAAVLGAGGEGSVAAVFAKAAYLRLPAGLVALTTADVHPGPLHARGCVALHRLRAGDAVAVDGRLLRAGPVTVDLGGAHTWRGGLPSAGDLSAAAADAIELLAAAPPSAVLAPGFEGRLGRARAHLDRGRLVGAVDELAGLGPGLTPAGDDVLAGLLLVARARGGPAAEPALSAAAAAARTNDVARAFLAWAARGQSIAPVHDFLGAAARHDRRCAAGALRALLAVGHSSGADLALGLRLGLTLGDVFAPAR